MCNCVPIYYTLPRTLLTFTAECMCPCSHNSYTSRRTKVWKWDMRIHSSVGWNYSQKFIIDFGAKIQYAVFENSLRISIGFNRRLRFSIAAFCILICSPRSICVGWVQQSIRTIAALHSTDGVCILKSFLILYAWYIVCQCV